MHTIKVLGTGCSNCIGLERATVKAVEDLQLDIKVEKVEDLQMILAYGFMSTPVLVINDKIVLNGRIPDQTELREIIQKYLAS